MSPASNSSSVAATPDADRYLNAGITLDEGGVWSATFSATVGTETFVDHRLIPSTRLDVSGLVFDRLKTTSDQLTALNRDQIICGLMLYWLNQIKTVYTNYDDMSAIDQISFDMAIVAASSFAVKGFVKSSKSLTGEIKKIQTGDDAIEFHSRFAAIKTEEESIATYNEVWRHLNNITGISDMLFALTRPVIVAVGRRRKLRADMGLTDVTSPAYDIFNDEVMNFMYQGGYFNGIAG